jgi:predicted methyltransferase
MIEPLDGPSAQLKVSVGTVTVVEVKVGGSPLTERKAITLQPEGKIYVYFGDGVTTPAAATVSANGLIHQKDAKETYEAGEKQKVYMLSVSGTVNVVIVERA